MILKGQDNLALKLLRWAKLSLSFLLNHVKHVPFLLRTKYKKKADITLSSRYYKDKLSPWTLTKPPHLGVS